MKKNIVKIILVLLGNIILVDAIIESMDGIGRFAMILFGVVFNLIGAFIPFEKKGK